LIERAMNRAMFFRSWAHACGSTAMLVTSCATPSPPQQSSPVAAPLVSGPGAVVSVVNRSEPVLCAEKDNVSLLFEAEGVRRFTIEAAHPAYINTLRADSWDADWTSCDMSRDPAVPAQPKELVLYESSELKLVAYAHPTFWRKNDVPFRVGDRTEPGLHLVQLWVTAQGKSHELLVVYPPDGYFRAHPLPPEHLSWSAYGSSFLVGPIEEDAGRLLVNLRDIAFDPAERRFRMRYQDGSTSTLTLRSTDTSRTILDVELGSPAGSKRPFAALRSMYVTDVNADVARVAVKDPAARGWLESNIMSFAGAEATEVWTGRVVPSRHNTSAPDMVFHRFEH
jgi:hypothetical protein